MTEELLEDIEPSKSYVRLFSRFILMKYGGKTMKEAISILDSVKGMEYDSKSVFG